MDIMNSCRNSPRSTPTTDENEHPTARSSTHRPREPSRNCIDGESLSKLLPYNGLLSICEWLFVKELFTLRSVDRALEEVSHDEVLWKRVACHLWNSALVGRKHGCPGAADASSARLQKSGKERPESLSFEDVCLSMVRAWPTHVDFTDGPPEEGSDAVYRIVNGTMVQTPSPMRAYLRTSFNANGDTEGGEAIDGYENPVAFDLGMLTADGIPTQKPLPLCTSVVFRGALGSDRAVRANLPFPWMYASYDECLARMSRVVLSTMVESDGPSTDMCSSTDALLTHTVARLPFATLWPGNANPAPGYVGGSECTSTAGGIDIEYTGRVASGATENGQQGSSSTEESKEARLEQDLTGQDSQPLRKREPVEEYLLGSGPEPCFRVGHIAYFEVTVGEPMEPMDPADRAQDGRHRDECVAIGLATSSFPLSYLQPGWDYESWGYHSDDGLFYHRNQAKGGNSAATFGPGDTVGCALVYAPLFTEMKTAYLKPDEKRIMSETAPDSPDSRGMFFTKNGQYVATAFGNIPSQVALYPVVGLDSHSPVEFNFGTKPFAFDVPAFEHHVMQHLMNQDPAYAQFMQSPTTVVRECPMELRFTNPRVHLPYLRAKHINTGADGRDENDSAWTSWVNLQSQAMRTGMRRIAGTSRVPISECSSASDGDWSDQAADDESHAAAVLGIDGGVGDGDEDYYDEDY